MVQVTKMRLFPETLRKEGWSSAPRMVKKFTMPAVGLEVMGEK